MCVIFLTDDEFSVKMCAAGPLTGWLSDKYGAPLVAVGCLILGIPWLYPLTLSSKLAIFIVSLLFTMFFESGLVTPITVETAKLTETIPGVGYADTFGVFNIAYGSGSMCKYRNGLSTGLRSYALQWGRSLAGSSTMSTKTAGFLPASLSEGCLLQALHSRRPSEKFPSRSLPIGQSSPRP